MSVEITGRYVEKTFNSPHMCYVLETDDGDEFRLVTGSSHPSQVRERWMRDGRIKEMITIPYGTVVTIIGCPDGQNTMETPCGGDLQMKVRASEALRWNSANRHWYPDHNVETIIAMRHFDGNMGA